MNKAIDSRDFRTDSANSPAAPAARVGRRLADLVEELDSVFWEAVGMPPMFTSVTSRAEGLLGYPVERWLSDPEFWLSHVHPEDRDKAQNHWRRALSGSAPNRFEYRAVHADGRTLWLRNLLSVMLPSDNSISRSRGFLVDITAERSAQQELNRTNAALQLLHNVAVAANEASSPEEAFQTCLDLICGFTGWVLGHVYVISPAKPDQLIRTSLWHVDDPTRFESFMKLADAATSVAATGLPALARASGLPHWSLDLGDQPGADLLATSGVRTAFAFPVLLAGEVVAVLEFFGDGAAEQDQAVLELLPPITSQIARVVERTRADEAVRRREELYRLLAENSSDMITKHSPDGVCIYASPAALSLTGYQPDELIGRSLLELVDPRDAAELRGSFQECCGGAVGASSYRIRHKTGEVVWVESTCRSMCNLAGETEAQIVAVTRNITVRKRVEQSLYELTGRFFKFQDEERRRMARELHDTSGQTLTALGINIAIARESADKLPARAQKALTESVDLIAQCSSEMRTISHLLHPPLLDELGLGAALRWYAEGYSERSGIHVTVDIPRTLGRLPQDIETALFRVVQESLTNIHRHSDSPYASIRVERTEGRIVLEVRDAGKGIPAGTFDRYGVDTVSTLGVGIGGMRERIRQFGGRLEIHPANPGTIVRAVLPLE